MFAYIISKSSLDGIVSIFVSQEEIESFLKTVCGGLGSLKAEVFYLLLIPKLP